MNSNLRNAVLWVVLICVLALIWVVVRTGRSGQEQNLSFTEFMQQVDQNKVKKVSIAGNQVKGDYTDGAKLTTMIPLNYPDLYKTLREKNVNVEIKEAGTTHWVSILINAIPFV